MKRFSLAAAGLLAILAALSGGCNDGGQFARAYRITNRHQAIGGESALADLGDYVLENDRIRIAVPEPGNSVGPGVYGGSLIDADLQRSDPAHRAGRGLDQFTELFPIGNLAIPAICQKGEGKVESFCGYLGEDEALQPKVRILCDGSRPCRTCYDSDCQIDLSADLNLDYADPQDPEMAGPAAPSEEAAVLRIEGMSGNYLEALGLISIIGVKMTFRVRNDFILEPGKRHVRIRTMLIEAGRDYKPVNPDGEMVMLPSLTGPRALFSLLLGSGMFDTELPDMDPGVAGGDFLFFGDRLKLFAPGIGFDIYRNIRNKFAVGQDPLNNPITADFLAGVGKHVSYAIASSDPEGCYLLPILSGAVTAGFSHGAHCFEGECPGTPEQCTNVIDCSNVKSFVFERVFAVGAGDVASAAGALYEARGIPFGRIRGRVIDDHNHNPVTHAEVHVYPIPKNMAECRPGGSPDDPYTAGAEGFEEKCLKQRDYIGPISHLRTDKGALDLPEGLFSGPLPVGQYYLLAKVLHRPASRVVPVNVQEDELTEVVLQLPPPARIKFEVRDESNQRVPAKITIGQCLPNCSARLESSVQVDNCPAGRVCNTDTMRCEATCSGDGDCLPSGSCKNGRCVCQPTFNRKAALGESTFPPGMNMYTYTADGTGEVYLEPGTYDVWASRGFEYSVDKQQVQAVGNRTVELAMRVRRQVDTSGWISGDFHVHGQNSYDAVVKHRDRVMCFAGEGVEMLSTSDHDYITDLAPYVFELGLEKWVKTQVGIELTTVEIGHWLSFPLRYEEWRDGERVQEQGAIDWTGKFPEDLHREMHELGEFYPDEPAVVVVAHPRDSFFGYFDQFGLNPYDPSKVEGTMLEYFPLLGHVNPLAVPEAFSGTFDALELFNSKRYEMIRTPTAGEIRDYNQARSKIQAEADRGVDPAVIERNLIALDREYIKDILKRTPAEQAAIWNADGTAGCDLMTFCVGDENCENAGEICDRTAMACYRPCADEADCDDRACVDGRCEPGWTPAVMPCTSHEGIVDDWFRLMDYGVVRTGMGNSDTHQLFTQTEGGLPRNFVRVDAEQASSIDLREMNRAIRDGKLTASYGPFVEVWLGDAQIGDTYSAAAGAETAPLRIRVQSPGWFDVDRVEVYRSGLMIHVLTGAGDEMHPDLELDTSGLRLPNSSVVNLDVTLDEPVGESDAWFVVIAMGLDGRDLSPVYTEHPYLKIQIGDILSRSFSSIDLAGIEISSPGIPRVFRIYPYAVTNPVFLDVGGDGAYDAPNPTPDWADGSEKSVRSKSFPLSSSHIGKSPLAEPTDAQTWRVRQLRHFLYMLHQAFEHGRSR